MKSKQARRVALHPTAGPGRRFFSVVAVSAAVLVASSCTNVPTSQTPGAARQTHEADSGSLAPATPIVITRSVTAKLQHTRPPRGIGLAPDVQDVSFTSPADGFAVSGLNTQGPGEIQRTSDGGRHWRVAWRRPRTTLRWIGQTQGVVIAAGWYGARDHPLEVRSADGGRSWVLIHPVLPSSRGSLDSFSEWGDFDFVTPQIGFAFVNAADAGGGGGELLRTTDGGYVWHRASRSASGQSLGDVSSVDALSPDLVFAVGSGSTRRCWSEVFRSTDAGRSWVALRASCRDVPLYSVDFLNDRVGFVGGGFTPKFAGPGDPSQILFRTTDGGASFVRIFTRRDSRRLPGSSSPISGLAFADTSHGWATTGACDQGASGGCVGSTMTTSDGGRHWRKTPAKALYLSPISARSAWATDPLGAAARTSDAGRTWHVLFSPSSLRLGQVTSGGSRVFLATDRGVIVSRDSARTWHHLNWKSPEGRGHGGIHQVSSVRGGVVFGVTAGRREVALSTNRGRTLRFTRPPAQGRITGVHFSSASTGLVALHTRGCEPDTASLYATSDGGRTWSAQTDGPAMSIGHLASSGGLSAVLGRPYACGHLVGIQTEGSGWKVFSLPTEWSCEAISVAAPSTVWAVCSHRHPGYSAILQTSDAGKTWTEVKSPFGHVSLVDSSHGFATIYNNGGLWRTNDGGLRWRERWVRYPFDFWRVSSRRAVGGKR